MCFPFWCFASVNLPRYVNLLLMETSGFCFLDFVDLRSLTRLCGAASVILALSNRHIDMVLGEGVDKAYAHGEDPRMVGLP